MKMNVTDTVKQACGHWPRILPALGMKVIKTAIRPARFVAVMPVATAFALMTVKGAAHGTATGAAPVTA